MGGFECVTEVAGGTVDLGGEELFDGDRHGRGRAGCVGALFMISLS